MQHDSHQSCCNGYGYAPWRVDAERLAPSNARCSALKTARPFYSVLRLYPYTVASSLAWSLESDVFLWLQMGTSVPQRTTMLNWANLSERAQKIKGLNFCASQVCAHRINAFVSGMCAPGGLYSSSLNG